jgi:aerotaxis receptor
VRLHAGGVRFYGLKDLPFRIYRLGLSQRMALAVAALATVAVGGALLGLPLWAQLPTTLAAAAVVGGWLHVAVGRPVERCTDLAAQIAGCQLGGHLDHDMRDPVGQLVRNVWLANLNMRAIVDDVRTEVRVITTASKEIAQGSADLSARTEQQSASVQNTATSMEQISAAVQGTADTARQVAQLSESSRTVARDGGRAVLDLVATMNAIESSSRRVQEVIQVIEGIAFQTNLLSLNAAVEAARAGEQGKGFAVVAGEVRALAQRSSTAAKEIRQLIGASVEQVSGGAGQVKTTEAVIGNVVQSVERVSELVRSITAAAVEQSRGLGALNGAIAEIDQTTQHNAALSEQAAASCKTLEARADTLVRAVQIFKVGA